MTLDIIVEPRRLYNSGNVVISRNMYTDSMFLNGNIAGVNLTYIKPVNMHGVGKGFNLF